MKDWFDPTDEDDDPTEEIKPIDQSRIDFVGEDYIVLDETPEDIIERGTLGDAILRWLEANKEHYPPQDWIRKVDDGQESN